jgi:cell division FtsZ-interacting protein ZapD
VQKNRKEYMAVPRFPLTSVLGLAVTLLQLQAQVRNTMFSDGFFQSHAERERVLQELSSWTVAISLRAVAQKLQ